MYTEINLHDMSSSVDIRNSVFGALKYDISGIVTSHTSLHQIKDLIPDGFTLACVVDYPFGLSDLKSRQHLIIQAIKMGANTIDIPLNNSHFLSCNIKKIKEDVITNKQICDANKVTMRIILEYRKVEEKQLIKIVNSIRHLGVDFFIPSSGLFLDSYADNLTISSLLTTRCKINVISNGNVWNAQQYDNILKSNIYGVRLNSVENLGFVDLGV